MPPAEQGPPRSASERPASPYVALAVVARPHGVRGELRLKVFNPDSTVLERQRHVRLVPRDGEARLVRVRSLRAVPGALLVRLDGVDDREAAEALRGAQLEVPREAFDAIEAEDEHYVVDLIGSRVMLGDTELGTVADVSSYPTCDALVVARKEGGKLEVPLQGTYVGAIEDGVVHVLTIDGLE